MSRMLRAAPALVGLLVATGLYVWRGGHYPLAVDVMALGAVGAMAAVGIRELILRITARL